MGSQIPLGFLVLSLILPAYFIKFLIGKLVVSLSRLERGFLSIFLGQVVFVSGIFLLTFVFRLSWLSVLVPLILFLVLDFVVFYKLRTPLKPSKGLTSHEIFFLFVIFVAGIGFSVLLVRHMLAPSPDGFSTPHNTFGDLQYHLAIVNSFFPGDNFPPQNPIYSGVRLSYPFLIDFHSAVLKFVGFDLQSSLIVPGLIFGECFFALFLLFANRFLNNVWGAFIAFLVFVFNGGMGGYLVLRESFSSPSFPQNLAEKFSSVIDQYNFRFPNAVSSVFMAERPILVGLAAFFAIALLLWISFDKKRADRELLLAGFIIGLLPLWHTHTILAIALVLPFYFFVHWFRRKGHFSDSVKFILPIFYLSVPLGIIGMLWHLPQVFTGGQHFFGINPFWIVGSEGAWRFWFINLGVFPLLLLISFFVLDSKQRFFYTPFFLIFLFANVIKFQPFDWDNYKILLVWYAVSSVVVAELILFIFSRWRLAGKVVSMALLLSFVFSGIVLTVGDYLSFYGLFSKEDIELSNWEKDNTNPKDLILTGPQHNQFSILAGRRILMGYQGYLWTQGIDGGAREKDIRKMYHGDMSLIKRYNVKYIVVGYEEKKFYSPDRNFLDRNFPVVKETKNFEVYKVI